MSGKNSPGNRPTDGVLAALTGDTTATDARARLRARIAAAGGVRAVSAELSENPGYVSQVAAGKRRASNRLRAKLGLPPLTAPAPVCQTCGVVHVRRSCPARQRQPSGPRRVRYSERDTLSALALVWRLAVGSIK